MTLNPYEAPQYPGLIEESVPSSNRSAAQRAFRVAAVLLFGAAFYNYWEFDRAAIGVLPIQISRLYRTINIGWFFLGGLATWFFGLTALETVARVLRQLFAPGKGRADWLDCLYQSLLSAPHLAVCGVVLWVIWTYAFYRLHANFYAISWLVGVPAHLVAAAWYVPLLRKWWRLDSQDRHRESVRSQ